MPAFALGDPGFVERFLKAHGVKKTHAVREELARYGHGDGEAVQVTSPYMGSASPSAGADFAWHLRGLGTAPGHSGSAGEDPAVLGVDEV